MEIITKWFAEHQGMFLQYLIDFAIAIAIVVIGKWVARIVAMGSLKCLRTKVSTKQ